jgi:hypothetical protein
VATRQLVTVADDVDGSPATQTVSFALDGVTYEIDLSTRNADRLRAELAPWMEAGRRLARNGQPYRRVDLDAVSPRRRRRR